MPDHDPARRRDVHRPHARGLVVRRGREVMARRRPFHVPDRVVVRPVRAQRHLELHRPRPHGRVPRAREQELVPGAQAHRVHRGGVSDVLLAVQRRRYFRALRRYFAVAAAAFFFELLVVVVVVAVAVVLVLLIIHDSNDVVHLRERPHVVHVVARVPVQGLVGGRVAGRRIYRRRSRRVRLLQERPDVRLSARFHLLELRDELLVEDPHGHDHPGHQRSAFERDHEHLRVRRRMAALYHDPAARGGGGVSYARRESAASANARDAAHGVPQPVAVPVVAVARARHVAQVPMTRVPRGRDRDIGPRRASGGLRDRLRRASHRHLPTRLPSTRLI
mmetsp:Transcript_4331/g.15262  ORF Transcript_4331/g.15262 Transcript_4331/m.15262 type:complete len:334 (+) Transcript_4331:599-1600(+)